MTGQRPRTLDDYLCNLSAMTLLQQASSQHSMDSSRPSQEHMQTLLATQATTGAHTHGKALLKTCPPRLLPSRLAHMRRSLHSLLCDRNHRGMVRHRPMQMQSQMAQGYDE